MSDFIQHANRKLTSEHGVWTAWNLGHVTTYPALPCTNIWRLVVLYRCAYVFISAAGIHSIWHLRVHIHLAMAVPEIEVLIWKLLLWFTSKYKLTPHLLGTLTDMMMSQTPPGTFILAVEPPLFSLWLKLRLFPSFLFFQPVLICEESCAINLASILTEDIADWRKRVENSAWKLNRIFFLSLFSLTFSAPQLMHHAELHHKMFSFALWYSVWISVPIFEAGKMCLKHATIPPLWRSIRTLLVI